MQKNIKFLFVLPGIFLFLVYGSVFSIVRAADDNLVQTVYKSGDSAAAAAAEDADPNNLNASTRQSTSGFVLADMLVDGVEGLNPDYQSFNNPYGPVPYAMARGLLGLTQDATYYAFMSPDFIPYGEVYASLFSPKELLYDGGTAVYAAMFPDKAASENSFSILSKMTLLVRLWLFMIGVATVVLVVILVVAGFMIMFRQKVQGQTWVTLGMALQGVILGFIGAVASFAIGGFFFNFSKILVYFTANFFEGLYTEVVEQDAKSNDGDKNVVTLQELKIISPAEPASLIMGFFTTPGGKDLRKALGEKLKEEFGNAKDQAKEEVPPVKDCGLFHAKCIWNGVKRGASAVGHFFRHAWDIKGKLGNLLLGSLVGIIIKLAIGVAAFYVGFRIFFKLISVYVNMLMNIVLAPLIFVVGSLPGNSGQIKQWFKKMFMYSLVPPTMFFLVNFAYFLGVYDIAKHTGYTGMAAISGGAFDGGASAGIINIFGYGRLASFFILFLAPRAEDFLSENFGFKKSAAVEGASADLTKSLGKFIPGMG